MARARTGGNPAQPPVVETAPIARLSYRIAAEFLGTFVLVFGGCGTAIFAANFTSPTPVDGAPPVNVGFVGVALAFGLTVVVMAYGVGHISGGHFNPAVTIGIAASGRFSWRDVVPYIVTQIVAAIAASAVLYAIAVGRPGWTKGGFASNGYGDASPGHYSLVSALVIEVVLTAIFLFVILGTTDKRALSGFAPLAIGLALTLIHLISIPVDNTSVNPARSIGPAIFAGATALKQVWLFIVAPIVGALIAGLSYRYVLGKGH